MRLNRTAVLTVLPVVLIVLIGATLRLWQIGALPPGLYRDEAFYGLDGLRVLSGQFSIYFAANNGREGLFMYLLAPAIALLGRTPEALRITSAIVGSLTILAIYFAGRNMFSHRIGVLSAAILAINFWHLAISRVAFRAITLPLMLCVLMALIFAALRTNQLRPRLIYSTLAGAAFGITFYTYTSAQFTLPLVALFAISLWIGLRRELFARQSEEAQHRRRWSILAFSASAFIVLLPLLLWLTQHYGLYFNRAGQVSILNPVINNGDLIGTLLNNIVKSFGMFITQGDRIWRHNLSLRPAFDGWLIPAFLIGIGVCLWRWVRSWESRLGSEILGVETNVAPQFLLLWLGVFLIPTILAEDTPHYLRAIGALPAACMVAAIGLEAVLAWLSRRGLISGLTVFLRRKVSPPAFVAAVLIALSGINTVSDYFNDYTRRPIVAYWLEQQNVSLADSVNDYLDPSRAQNVVQIDKRLADDNAALQFLVPAMESAQDADDRYSIRVAQPQPGMEFGRLIVDPNHDWTAMRNSLPSPTALRVTEGPLAQADKEEQPRRAFVTVDYSDGQPPAIAKRTFERGIGFLDGSVAPASGNLYTVTLTWSATQPITEDLAVFVHWVRNGEVVAQSDASPAQGYLPFPTWRPGDWIVDQHLLAPPGGVQAGDEVRVGIYRREGNQRLRVTDAHGAVSGDYVIISPLQ
jgi:4-amino-4-deoxy-L-arabinose transferase-like glycosyltransferase